MDIRKTLLTLIIVPLLLGAVTVPNVRAQSSSPTVTLFNANAVFDSVNNYYKVVSGPGDNVALDVMVQNVLDLSAYDLLVRYPGGFLTASATLAGTPFDPDSGPFAGNVDVLLLDVAPDFIRVAVDLRGGLGFDGSGSLISMHFQVNDFGTGLITMPNLILVDSNIDQIFPSQVFDRFFIDAGSKVDVTLINRSTQTDFGHVFNIRLEGTTATFKSRIKNIGTSPAFVYALFELRSGDRTLTAKSSTVSLDPGVEIELSASATMEDVPLRFAVSGSVWMSSNGLFFVQSPHGVDTLTFKVLPTCNPFC